MRGVELPICLPQSSYGSTCFRVRQPSIASVFLVDLRYVLRGFVHSLGDICVTWDYRIKVHRVLFPEAVDFIEVVLDRRVVHIVNRSLSVSFGCIEVTNNSVIIIGCQSTDKVLPCIPQLIHTRDTKLVSDAADRLEISFSLVVEILNFSDGGFVIQYHPFGHGLLGPFGFAIFGKIKASRIELPGSQQNASLGLPLDDARCCCSPLAFPFLLSGNPENRAWKKPLGKRGQLHEKAARLCHERSPMRWFDVEKS